MFLLKIVNLQFGIMGVLNVLRTSFGNFQIKKFIMINVYPLNFMKIVLQAINRVVNSVKKVLS